MASFTANNTKSKNQFTARVISKKTGAMLGWFHPVDELARKLIGVSTVSEITPIQALSKLPQFFDNDLVELAITDLTADQEVVEPTAY